MKAGFNKMKVQMKKDIEELADVRLMVDEFYTKVRGNQLIGPVFNKVIKDRWPAHLEKMYRFWQTVLLDEHTYYGSPFVPHARLPVHKEHFECWQELFFETVDENFDGPVAAKAKMQAHRMAIMFENKIEYYRNNPGVAIL